MGDAPAPAQPAGKGGATPPAPAAAVQAPPGGAATAPSATAAPQAAPATSPAPAVTPGAAAGLGAAAAGSPAAAGQALSPSLTNVLASLLAGGRGAALFLEPAPSCPPALCMPRWRFAWLPGCKAACLGQPLPTACCIALFIPPFGSPLASSSPALLPAPCTPPLAAGGQQQASGPGGAKLPSELPPELQSEALKL